MLAVRIPNKLEARLAKLAKVDGPAQELLVRQALAAHWTRFEDTYTALYRLENSGPPLDVSTK